ncbi:hypothetical protein L0F63_006473 [Massospora cicadina]|nr:hypothetical protein L0F63_006473 [Massospora cicadina]
MTESVNEGSAVDARVKLAANLLLESPPGEIDDVIAAFTDPSYQKRLKLIRSHVRLGTKSCE